MKKINNEKGFTLIELLAVVTIMGVLSLVAVPMITSIIQNVRKDVYVQDALNFVKLARQFTINSNYPFEDPDTTYYIHIKNLTDDDYAQSPFADWKEAYVGVVSDIEGNKDFYWVSIDEAGYKIDLKKSDKLDRKDVYYEENSLDINNRLPIQGKRNIVIIGEGGLAEEKQPWYQLSRDEAKKCYSFKDLNADEIMISYYNSACGTDVVIPSRVGNKKITAIHSYTFRGMGLTSVYIPDTIKTIGTGAFSFNNIEEVRIQSGVNTIGSNAFTNNHMKHLIIEDGVKTMGSSCFQYNDLTEAIVPSTVTSLGTCAYCDNPIPNPSFLYVTNKGKIDYSRIRGYIGNLNEFPSNKFVIPAENHGVKLKRIEGGAFYDMTLRNREVQIPPTVEYIGDNAFSFGNMEKVNLPSGLKYIGSHAFYSNNLREIKIPNSVTYIGTTAFNNNNVTSEDEKWIYKRDSSKPNNIDYSTLIGYAGGNKQNLVIPPKKNGIPLKQIGNSCFSYLSLYGNIKIPSTVTYIGANSFACNSIQNVDNGDGKWSGPYVYKRFSNGKIDYSTLLTYTDSYTEDVTLPNNIKHLSDYAFYYSYIRHVNLPEGLETIGNSCFTICRLEGEIVIPSTVRSIGYSAFPKEISWTRENADLVKIVNKTGRAFNWQQITRGPSPATFKEGIVENWYGNIEVVSK